VRCVACMQKFGEVSVVGPFGGAFGNCTNHKERKGSEKHALNQRTVDKKKVIEKLSKGSDEIESQRSLACNNWKRRESVIVNTKKVLKRGTKGGTR